MESYADSLFVKVLHSLRGFFVKDAMSWTAGEPDMHALAKELAFTPELTAISR